MGSPIQVLYVDDQETALNFRAELLRSEQMEIITETDTALAMEYIVAEEIDCVLSDFDMPADDGVDFLEKVREIDQELPFILFTVTRSESLVDDALNAGATDYFPKSLCSLSPRLLVNRIEQAVQLYRSQPAEI